MSSISANLNNIPSVTLAQAIEIDNLMTEKIGISESKLMEIAGYNAAQCIKDNYPLSAYPKILLLCGKGHNGGDGLVIARHLSNQGYEIEVIMPLPPADNLVKSELHSVKSLGISVGKNPTELINPPDLIVDALLGLSSVGAPRGEIKDCVDYAVGSNKKIISIDLPTGFDVQNNIWHNPSIKGADVVTFVLPKENMIKNPGIEKLFIADIGVPQDLLKKAGILLQGNPFNKKGYLEIK